MIHVVCDPGSRYTKFAVVRADSVPPVFVQFPSYETDDLERLARQAASALKPGFLESVQVWIVGDGWVPKRTRFKPILTGAAIAKATVELGESVLVADCGGLRTRVYEVAAGTLKRTLENERCTSGGGRFVETMAAALRVDLDQIDAAIARASAPVRVSSPCMVFAESEMISQVNSGVPREDVLAGVVAHAVEKVSTLVLQAGPSGRPLVVIGGLARLASFRQGIVDALPGVTVLVAPGDPMYFNCACALDLACDVPLQGWTDGPVDGAVAFGG